MKLVLYLSGIGALWMLCLPAALSAQPAGRKKPSTTNLVLHLAEKTIDAIREKDTGFLRALADGTGVYIGFDTPKMSATQFRRELSEKRGAYCVIFDVTCLNDDFRQSPSVSSLRDVLVGQPVTMTMAREETEGASEVVSVAVKKASDPHEVLFTLYFRHVRDHWGLQQIEFY